MKRFQECSGIVKLWRYRWYLLIPFKWVYYKLRDNSINNRLLWRLLVGTAQIKMHWYYTSEEVFEKLKNKL